MSPEAGNQLVDDVLRRVRVVGWVAGVMGAAVVFIAIGFLIPIFHDEAQRSHLGSEALPWVAAALLVGGGSITYFFGRDLRTALAWVREGCDPTEREHRLTLQLASRAAAFDMAAWVIGGVFMGAVSAHHGLGFSAVVVSAIWLGGETCSALLYLLYERILRPITALALSAREPERSVAPGIRNRLLFAWSLGTGVPILGVLVVGIVGVTKSGVEVDQVAGASVFLGGVAVAVGLFATLVSARAIADPVNAVRKALDQVADGNFEMKVAINDSSEVGVLQAGFNRMAEGLRERERIRDLFGRQVGKEVARAALRDGTRLGGEEREIGALFVDLTGSTTMALAMPPAEVVRLLNRFFRVVIEVVEEKGGVVNKFEGDAALCIFGAPVASADPAGEALCAARALAERLDREVPEIDFGIGVSAGPAVAGNVGAEHRFEYTVIGDPVNEAARLCELAKERPEQLMASGAALERASGDEPGVWELTERTVLRGRLDATGLALPRS
jgi:adenylate cyclase